MNAPDVARIQPPTTEIARPYWEGCRAGELRMQYCEQCERFQFYPRIICSHCGAEALTWRVVSGRGCVASFTVVRRGISPAYSAPYVVALIDLEEGVRLMSNVVGCDPDQVTVGDAVAVRFESWGSEHVLPVFALTSDRPDSREMLQDEQT
jgi:uncharacterized OB-fold protein